MATYSAMELRLIEAAKGSLARDKELAKRTRLLESGVDPAEADRRLAQSSISRQAHLRVLADPTSSQELARFSKAQSDAARRCAGTEERLVSDGSADCEIRTLDFLREHGPAKAHDVARAVSGSKEATKSYINPMLYRLASRGEVTFTDRGWAINHSALKAQILCFLEDTAFNALELSALLGANADRTKAALDELTVDGNLFATHFETPSGNHLYYCKLSD